LLQRPAPVRPASLAEQADRVGEPLVVAVGRKAEIVEAAQHRVVPVPRIRELCEALGDDLAGAVGAVEPVGEQQLDGSCLRLAEALFVDHAALGADAQRFEHVERRMERAVLRPGVVADGAVPAAVVELRVEDRLPQWAEPRIRAEKVRAHFEPEAEVAEVDALQEERAVHLGAGRHEPPEQALDWNRGGRMSLGAPSATSRCSVQVDAVHRPCGHSPSAPWCDRSSAIQPDSTACSRSACQAAGGASSRSRSTCQRIDGSPSRSHSTACSSMPLRFNAMPEQVVAAELDRLYELPLGEFTAARDKAAKRLRAYGEHELAA